MYFRVYRCTRYNHRGSRGAKATRTAHQREERTHHRPERQKRKQKPPTQPGRNPNSPEHRANLGAIPGLDPQAYNGARSDQTAGLGGLVTHSETTLGVELDIPRPGLPCATLVQSNGLGCALLLSYAVILTGLPTLGEPWLRG